MRAPPASPAAPSSHATLRPRYRPIHIPRWVAWLAASGVVLAAAATAGSWWRAEERAWVASSAAATLAPQRFAVDASWIRDGQPQFRTAEIARAPDGRSVTGVWVCDGPTTFEWHFELDETVYVLEGRVEIAYLGQRFVLEPGQTAVFKAGTTAVWRVPNHLKKVFVLHNPGRLTLWWRALRQRLGSA